jgi:GR25 family glycosyltransferase involved in LPS biosynthesis
MKSLIDTYFDKIYYINLDNDKQRNENILNQFKTFNIKNFERISATSYNQLPPSFSLFRNFNKQDTKYVLGQLGCRSSHLNIVNDAKTNSYKKILIFEDDIKFLKDPNEVLFNNRETLNKDWDFLYFGGLVEPMFRNQIVTTHSYAIYKKVFDDIIYMAEPSGMEIDNFYAKIMQHMSYNYNPEGRYIVKPLLPFNSIVQDKQYESNIN